jgi:hypothetical protein
MDKKPPPGKPAGVAGGMSVYQALKSDTKDIQLLVDENHLIGYVAVVFHTSGVKVTAEEIEAFLSQQKVKVSDEGLASVAKAVGEAGQSAGVLGPILVVQGKRAKNGTDGRIEWLAPPPMALRQQKAAAGRVDYREFNQIVNVRQGQQILSIIEPTPGEPGEDIFGVATACQAGRAASIRRGKNVEVTENGRDFFAQTTGMLQVSGDSVLVEPQLTVPNDVDMSVGNINFVGPVKISRDVRDGFRVKAGKDIEVGGMVEGATLEAGGYIRVQGGIAGKGRSRIICKGNLEAKYLSEVFVEAGGDIIVANSITTATVKSLGKIIVNNGGIRGASVVAAKGLRTPELGSESGTRTVVVVGIDYRLKDKLVNMERELAAVREAVERIEAAMGPLLADGEIIATLPPEKSEIALRLMSQLDILLQRGNELAAKRDAMLAKMQVGADMVIEISKKIYAGVVMQIGTCRRTFELDINGPVKIRPDIENGSVKVTR